MNIRPFSKTQFILISILLVIGFTSCFEEDSILQVEGLGNADTVSIVLGEKYGKQIFFDLTSNSIKSTNEITDWDLAFDCSDDNWYIFLNSTRMMLAGTNMQSSFEELNSDADLDMDFDHSNGIPDSSAIGKWYQGMGDSAQSLAYAYVIDMGYDTEVNHLGKKKISVEIDNNSYKLRYANLDGSDEKMVTIEKDENYNRRYLSFENGLVDIAPEKEEWGLLFSKYSTMLETDIGDPYPYVVTGVILNPNNMMVALDTTDFESIELSDSIHQSFTTNLDGIGWDWKEYSFDTEMYTVHPDRTYYIKNHDGFYFKLRFHSFYGPTGEKGTITFEVEGM